MRLGGPVARQPVGEDDGEEGELDEADQRKGEGDVVLPAGDDARGTDDAHQLEDAQHAQQPEELSVGCIRLAVRLEEHAVQPGIEKLGTLAATEQNRKNPSFPTGTDAREDGVEGDAGEDVDEEPAAQVRPRCPRRGPNGGPVSRGHAASKEQRPQNARSRACG